MAEQIIDLLVDAHYYTKPTIEDMRSCIDSRPTLPPPTHRVCGIHLRCHRVMMVCSMKGEA
jgi:hypothetical protein